MVKEIFSTRVRELRQAAGLTQKQLGEALGLARVNINMIENCGQFTHPDTFVQIAKFFHVTTDYLLGQSNDPRKTNLDDPDPLARIA